MDAVAALVIDHNVPFGGIPFADEIRLIAGVATGIGEALVVRLQHEGCCGYAVTHPIS